MLGDRPEEDRSVSKQRGGRDLYRRLRRLVMIPDQHLNAEAVKVPVRMLVVSDVDLLEYF